MYEAKQYKFGVSRQIQVKKQRTMQMNNYRNHFLFTGSKFNNNVAQFIINNQNYGSLIAQADISAPLQPNNRHVIPNFEMAHMIADRFGAPLTPNNLVSLTRPANNNMRTIENRVAQYINQTNGAIVHYHVMKSLLPYNGQFPTGGAIMPAGVYISAIDMNNGNIVVPNNTFVPNQP